MDSQVPPTISPAPASVPPIQRADRTWDVLCHLAALAMFVPVIPLGHIVGPLLVWLIKRGDSPSVDAHGKESLNFQLSLTIYGICAFIIAFFAFLSIVGVFFLPVLIGVLLIMGILNLVFIITAAVKAGDGKPYHYPLAIRLIT